MRKGERNAGFHRKHPGRLPRIEVAGSGRRARIAAKLPAENRDTSDLGHTELALQAYNGSRLSQDHEKKNLYDFLELSFEAHDTAP
ncbi:MAG TPA: hypothetical protein VEW48_26520 [Thermoanaerobaculia bacterium]|nr:hypothetical protein [Thermoanaerobaculia bacterium]